MWALVESNNISRLFTRPTALTIGDVQYPANIMSRWTASELEAIGIYIVVEDESNLKDEMYYNNTDRTYAFASGVVTSTRGTATAKNLADSGSGDSLVRGLKTLKKDEVNNQAHSLLSQYDWYTLRAADGGTAVPSTVTTYKAAVRTAANSMCTKIDNAANVDALAALYVYNSDDPPTRPLGEWPDEPTI